MKPYPKDVHTHGPEEGPSLNCPEYLIGRCQIDLLEQRIRELESEKEEVVGHWKQFHAELRKILGVEYNVTTITIETAKELKAERDRLKAENEQLNDVRIPCVHVAQDIIACRCIKCNYEAAKAGMQYAHKRLATAEKLLEEAATWVFDGTKWHESYQDWKEQR